MSTSIPTSSANFFSTPFSLKIFRAKSFNQNAGVLKKARESHQYQSNSLALIVEDSLVACVYEEEVRYKYLKFLDLSITLKGNENYDLLVR